MRQVYREDILNRIREAIFSGELKPGDRVIETTWAKELGVSQGPVREAIRDLEALGLVETVPFKGSRVKVLSKKDILDNYGVRMCLEEKSIKDVLKYLTESRLQELDIELQKIIDDMDKCAGKGDLGGFTDCDTRFHRTVIEATNNPVLLKLWEQCNMRNWSSVAALNNPKTLKRLQEGHKNILKAFRERDSKEARVMLSEHLTGLMNDYINTME